MENQEITQMIAQAQSMLKSDTIDNEAYHHIENFILKNSSRLSADSAYAQLKSIMSEVALKHNLKDIAEIQENFGLNSCAQ